jgi:hypothetical protein
MLRAAYSAPSTVVAELKRSAKMKTSKATKWATGIACTIFGLSGAASLIGGKFAMRGYRIEGMSARLAGAVLIIAAIYGYWLIFRKEKSGICG